MAPWNGVSWFLQVVCFIQTIMFMKESYLLPLSHHAMAFLLNSYSPNILWYVYLSLNSTIHLYLFGQMKEQKIEWREGSSWDVPEDNPLEKSLQLKDSWTMSVGNFWVSWISEILNRLIIFLHTSKIEESSWCLCSNSTLPKACDPSKESCLKGTDIRMTPPMATLHPPGVTQGGQEGNMT